MCGVGLGEFLYYEGAIILGILVAVGVGMLALPSQFFRIARICFILAGIGFVSIGIMWGWSTTESVAVRIAITGILGFAAAVGTTEALRFIKQIEVHQKHEIAPSSPSAPPGQGGRGGSGTVEGNNALIIGGRGGPLPS